MRIVSILTSKLVPSSLYIDSALRSTILARHRVIWEEHDGNEEAAASMETSDDTKKSIQARDASYELVKRLYVEEKLDAFTVAESMIYMATFLLVTGRSYPMP
jgi:hypothetical protein